ncbi:autotransporter outer membrane beta-barrel domain-containing protein [Brucella oryzae]|uniref:autotransporter outer membrane beta-barrel domain-containing protein n=1 Tax=Brucella oryzae TaxID=335286 RepID=UPI0035BC3CA7
MGQINFTDESGQAFSVGILRRLSNHLARHTALLPVALSSVFIAGTTFSTSAQVVNDTQYWTGSPNWNNFDATWIGNVDGLLGAWERKKAVFSELYGGSNRSVSLTTAISANELSFLDNGFRIDGPATLQLNAPAATNSKINVETGTAIIAASVTSTVALDKTGAGTLALEGNNSIPQVNLYGGTVALNSLQSLNSLGYVNFNGGNLKVGDGTFSGSATSLGYFASTLASVDVASGVDYTIDAVNSTGSFVKDGAGTLNLKRGIANFVVFNQITVHDGTLKTSSDLLGYDRVDVAGKLIIEDANDATSVHRISKTLNDRTGQYGTVTKSGNSRLTYRGLSNNDWTVQEGTLITGVNNIFGSIENNANLILNDTAGFTHFGLINGTGDVTFDAGLGMHLYGNYRFTGEASVSNGAVTLGSYADLSTTRGLTMGNGTNLNVSIATLSNLTLKTGSSLTSTTSNSVLKINGDMTAEAGSTLNFAVGSPSSNSRIRVFGNLNIDNVGLNITQSPNPAAGTFGVGYYRLIDYYGSYSGNGFSSLTVPLVPSMFTQLVYRPNTVDLLVTRDGDNSLQHWIGGDGTWDSSTPAWINDGGSTPDLWGSKIAIFKDTPSTIGGVINVDGNQSFTGLQFVDNGYTLVGTGSLLLEPGGSEIRVLADSATINTEISGSGSLLKTEAGTLVLNGNNSYTGGTTIYAGDVQINSDANLGTASGGINLKGGTLTVANRIATSRQIDIDQSGTLNVTDGNMLMANGVVSGSGVFVKEGSGTLVLSGANTFSGDIGIKKGSLEVDNDAALGDAANDITFLGGVLTTTGSFATSRDFNLNANGEFNVAGSTQLAVNGNVVGSNVLVKDGTGVLVLNGTNSFNGLDVLNGSVMGNSASISGDIRNTGTVTFNVAGNEKYNGNIQGVNASNGTMVKDGAGTLTLGGISMLDWTINQGQLIVDANKYGGDVNVGTQGTAVFNQAENGTLAGTLSGTGTVVKDGAGTLFITGDNSSFDGLVRIASGRINTGAADTKGSLGGSLIVESGGSLSGVGIIGSGSSSMITVAAGGMLAPGNSIGTLTINGNLVLESGSIYNVETDPLSTDSDRVKVSGDATINGGTVAHIGFAGDYALNTKYTILQADGELSGSFGNVTSEFAFLNPTLLYDYSAGSVQLELPRNDVQFISKGTTPNHLAVANALDSMGTNSKVYNAFVKLPDDKTVIGNALDSLSGEIYGSTTSALIEESHYVRDIVNNRMRFALGGIVMSDAMSSQQIDQTWNAWAQAYGGWNKIGGNSNYADVKHSTGGFMVGVDTIVENGWLVGAFAGYSNSTIKADARASSASVDSFHIGAYVNGGVKTGHGAEQKSATLARA